MFRSFTYLQPGEKLSLIFFACIIVARIAAGKGGNKGGGSSSGK